MADNGDDFQKRVQEALAKGEPLPGFPSMSPLESLGMAMHETALAFEKAGFMRGEALYMTSSMFTGNPGAGPAAHGGSGGSAED